MHNLCNIKNSKLMLPSQTTGFNEKSNAVNFVLCIPIAPIMTAHGTDHTLARKYADELFNE